MDNAAVKPVGIPLPEEREVPAEIRRTNAGSSHAAGCVLAAISILVPAVVYFGFLGLLLLDDLVLENQYLGKNLPPQVFDWLIIIYWPLIVLTRWALGIK